MLDAAAVSGAEFELGVVAEVVGLPVDDALDVLDAAVKGRPVAEVPHEPRWFAFVHAIVRDTLAGSLTAARRMRLHELFAAALEGPERRAELQCLLGETLGRAGLGDKGDQALRKASELAHPGAEV